MNVVDWIEMVLESTTRDAVAASSKARRMAHYCSRVRSINGHKTLFDYFQFVEKYKIINKLRF